MITESQTMQIKLRIIYQVISNPIVNFPPKIKVRSILEQDSVQSVVNRDI